MYLGSEEIFKNQNWAIDGVWDVNRSPVELNYRLGWIPRIGFFITILDYP